MPETAPDLLFLAHRVPFPPDKGDRIRTYHWLSYLAQRARVHLACLSDEPVDETHVATLRRLCARVAVVPLGATRWMHAGLSWLRGRTISAGAFHSPALLDVLRGWARQTRFHAMLATSSSLVPYLRLPELRGVPAVVDLIDVDSQKWFDYAGVDRGPKSWLHRLEGTRLRRLEAGLPAEFRAVTLVSQAEAELYHSFCAPGNVQVVTNGVDLDYFTPRADVAEDAACVFVGALDYRPNIEGIEWFCREVWPELRRRQPGTCLRLVGRRPTAALRRLSDQPGVELIGEIPDVRPHVARSKVVVVPLQTARGLQNKVLEALAMAKAVVATPRSLNALRVEPGTHLLSAETPAAWVEATLRLLADDQLRRNLGQAGRRYVEAHHRWECCLEPLGALFDLPREPGVDSALGSGARPTCSS